MSLDVYLTELGSKSQTGTGIFLRENGTIREISWDEWNERFPGQVPVLANSDDECVFSRNITHNLNTMANEAGIYQAMWRPDEVGITKAHELIEPLQKGLATLQADPERFKQFNPANGWGDYGGLVDFVQSYLDACIKHPTADISVSR